MDAGRSYHVGKEGSGIGDSRTAEIHEPGVSQVFPAEDSRVYKRKTQATRPQGYGGDLHCRQQGSASGTTATGKR